MQLKATVVPYSQTGYFSGMVMDYLKQGEKLQSFYANFPDADGLRASIQQRKAFNQNRNELVQALKGQYANEMTTTAVLNNIELLKRDTTFTITTAHQPNIFTGPLYFVYKILHAVKLAAHCKNLFPEFDFVPVYFMGSEDADLDELGHIYLSGEKLSWETGQTGAVGRMKVDKALLQLISRIESEVGVHPWGAEISEYIRKFYTEGTDIQTATFGLVNQLFGKYGLLVLIPDNPALKKMTVSLFKDELLHQRSSKIVKHTAEQLLDKGYKVQASGRDINLFYLGDNIRQRIEKTGDRWIVSETGLNFDEAQMMAEIENHPERLSPNVILRGLFQEMILPNIAFIGGGGELAYWLQLKDLFDHYRVPYPALLLRNSFLLAASDKTRRVTRLGFGLADLFRPLKSLEDEWIAQHSNHDTGVRDIQEALEKIYTDAENKAAKIDKTLVKHVAALQAASHKKITALGKKLLRAEKRNHADAMGQLQKLKHQLFPFNNLQERIDNMVPYYARWGSDWMDALLEHSLSTEQQFVILTEAG